MLERINAHIKRIKQKISETLAAISYRVRATVSFLLLALATLWAAITQTPLATDSGGVGALGQAGTANSRLVCNRGNAYCVLGHNGAYIDLYADKGITRKFYADGATGALTANNAIAANGNVASGNVTAATVNATNLTLNGNSFTGAVSFGTIAAGSLVHDCTVCPRYSAVINHGLGAAPSACIVAGAGGINEKLASIYNLSTNETKVFVSEQGSVFWICGK